MKKVLFVFTFFLLYATASFLFYPSKAYANISVGGYVRSTTGAGIPGVAVRVKNSDECASCGTTVVTDSNGFWIIPNKTPEDSDYAVRFDNPAPPGYTGPALTTTTSCSYQTCCSTDTLFHSVSYETQPANGCGCAASNQGVSYRCNFEYFPAPTSTPTKTLENNICN